MRVTSTVLEYMRYETDRLLDRQNRLSVGVHRSRGKSNFATKSGPTEYQNTGIGQMKIPPFGRTYTVIRSIAIILMTRMFKAEAQKRKRKHNDGMPPDLFKNLQMTIDGPLDLRSTAIQRYSRTATDPEADY
ncbi:uncharacterized protein Bfra_006542 [Botrytis fragariae]|uniref:Uncharacterized protein n=1 Tax=Botrytis fragariae TaxID=1964551 RepID=A0A8H6B505_9HELO|nr:uncharacterized protein Bfra_006542 [Botrytis fragariae]KAF5879334.1 hypothetical protein Bfra_006542 [Botrytis fragariae]